MPLYDYECPACGDVKEVNHSVGEIGKIEIVCSNCQQPMKKLLSIPTLIGFDNVGRSIGKKYKEKEPKKDTSTKTAPKKDKAA